MTISPIQRHQTEQAIRAAMDRLLRGNIPPGSACDISTLAREAEISRAALYRSYAHLKTEFTRRLTQMQADGHLPDPRAAQIARLKDDNAQLRQRLRAAEDQVDELVSFQTTAISRLVAQHDEITRLRTALADRANLRTLPASLRKHPRPDLGGQFHPRAPGFCRVSSRIMWNLICPRAPAVLGRFRLRVTVGGLKREARYW